MPSAPLRRSAVCGIRFSRRNMSRTALLLALLLHAAIAVMLGCWWRPQTFVRHADSATSGVGVSFLSEDQSPPESESITSTPVPEPAPPELAAEPTPETPVTAVATAPSVIEASTATAPEKAESPAPKATKKPRVASAPRGGNAGARPGAGGSNSGGTDLGQGGSGFTPPQFRVRYKAPYPMGARALRLEGTVLLSVSVDSGGRVTSARISQSCGHPILDNAALNAVRTWQFVPAQKNGIALAAQVEIPVGFRME